MLYPETELHLTTSTFQADTVLVEACKAGEIWGVYGDDTDFIALIAVAQACPAFEGKTLNYMQASSTMVRRRSCAHSAAARGRHGTGRALHACVRARAAALRPDRCAWPLRGRAAAARLSSRV